MPVGQAEDLVTSGFSTAAPVPVQGA
jgi:hypothetical protein